MAKTTIGGRRTTILPTSTQPPTHPVSTPTRAASTPPIRAEAAQISHIMRSSRWATRLINC
jgi:hypothetical protein